MRKPHAYAVQVIISRVQGADNQPVQVAAEIGFLKPETFSRNDITTKIAAQGVTFDALAKAHQAETQHIATLSARKTTVDPVIDLLNELRIQLQQSSEKIKMIHLGNVKTDRRRQVTITIDYEGET